MKQYKLFLKNLYRYNRVEKSPIKLALYAGNNIFKFYAPKSNYSKGKQIDLLLDRVNINLTEDGFIYFIDTNKTIYKENRVIDNITLDYEYILNTSLKEMKKTATKFKNDSFKINQIDTINAIEKFIDRICSLKNNKYTKYIANFKETKANSFEEALQRILFYNQILWQTNHNLNGLGRLDYILNNLYNKDIKSKKLTKEKAYELITDFCVKLNKYYWFKSNGLVGDTGQVIVLGGLTEENEYFKNDLTELFIKVIKNLGKPDPKTILRVSKKTPDYLLELAFDSIKTGIGNPLLSNDDVVIPVMINFGYEKHDAYNYCTAACWEPYVAGKSFDQNNIDTYIFINPLIKTLENVENIDNYKKLLEEYKLNLKKDLNNFIEKINNIKFEEDPIVSLVSKSCIENQQDISNGGAKYNNYGLTTVSLSNTINSLLNIKQYCYDEKKLTLKELNDIRKNNFKNNEQILKKLKNSNKRYGTDNEDVIKLTNEITNYANLILESKINPLGGKYKFGLSSPAYITMSKFPATLDGRKDNDPFNVHISNDSNKNAYTELINFASRLDYNQSRFNGNVVDLILNPNIIQNNTEKFIKLLKIGIKKGFFQMQINVINSETLIKAKLNPEEYPNLIVRVWGFSAYFNDLPESYKDLLIERTLINEGKN